VLKIKDWDTISKKFIFIDDNFPVYQADSLDMPTKRYLDIPESEYTDAEAKKKADKEWTACKISHFIVALYKKIYLEAYVATKFVKELLSSEYFEYADNREIHIRTFLCSARSYRKYVMLSDMPDKLKSLIMEKSFPKFVWITEVTSHWTAFG